MCSARADAGLGADSTWLFDHTEGALSLAFIRPPWGGHAPFMSMTLAALTVKIS